MAETFPALGQIRDPLVFLPAATMIASSCFQILFGLAVDPGLVTWSDAKASCVATQVFS